MRIALMGAFAVAGCSERESAELPADAAPPEPTAVVSATASAEVPAPPEREPPLDRWGDKLLWDGSLEEQNAYMLDQLAFHHGIDEKEREALEKIFAEGGWLGQGNPGITRHPMSVAECRDRLQKEEVSYQDARFESICDDAYMAPLYAPDSEKPEDAPACIDRFEFPNIPCAYPVTWVRAKEAVEICRVLGKRLCDAHEWEGACWGKLEPPDYDFEAVKRFPDDVDKQRKAMRHPHNRRREKDMRWAYGAQYKKGVCGTASNKSRECTSIGWKRCGTNTFPAGSFPTCMSPLGVQDLHGNAAEHMNLPLAADQMSTAPEQKYGQTEMKGSWFVFDQFKAHEDHCRWRAPDWHGGAVMSPTSHHNYHLGFRCCKSLAPKK
jgi:formylglycine-generating enzyme required for sulfatase activity